ncbi:MAG: LppP/LprE family lipoprotein [Acidobacteria bacterium]|nr:LppP/LprE family lipoprotein [Acidobacteriota bacterium]
MFLRFKTIKFLITMLAVGLPLVSNAFAQNLWLDQKPLPNWNERSRTILQTRKISNSELKRCSVGVRQPTLPADLLLAKMGWTLVGAAQIHGKTTVVTVTEAFDGMCRPLKFQMFVFVGNRLAGTLSPSPMDSRTDSSLIEVDITSETNLTAEYARYRESDPLCCPYKTEAVNFVIKRDGESFLLTPASSKISNSGQ